MRRRKKHFTFSFFFDHFMKVIQHHKRYLKLCPVNQYILLNFKRTIVLFVRIFEVIGGIGIVSWHEEQLDRILPLLLRCILCCFSEIIRLAWTISQDKAVPHTQQMIQNGTKQQQQEQFCRILYRYIRAQITFRLGQNTYYCLMTFKLHSCTDNVNKSTFQVQNELATPIAFGQVV